MIRNRFQQFLDHVVRSIRGQHFPADVRAQYGTSWDDYSDRWESSVQKAGMQNLGDEWGTASLTDEIVQEFVVPHLPPGATVLEIGCGAGKFSVRLAPLSKVLICADVSRKMLERAKIRLGGFSNVRFETLNGLDLKEIEAGGVDFVFSFDCFVHLEMEDLYCYLAEIGRVLHSGSRGVLHFANLNSDEGWKKFISEAPLNRGTKKHFDRLCFLTWEIVNKFFDSLDFKILKYRREPWRDILVVFEKTERQDDRVKS